MIKFNKALKKFKLLIKLMDHLINVTVESVYDSESPNCILRVNSTAQASGLLATTTY
jgi:hypothetical protein